MLQTSQSIGRTKHQRLHSSLTGLCSLLLATTFSVTASADSLKVYKSIDADGNVTYSAEPAQNAVQSEQLLIEAAPSEKDFNEATQRARSFQKEADRLDESRKRSQQKRNETRQAANQSVQQAEQELAQAKQIKDSDWQGLSGGGRVLKQSYHQRVKAAQNKLDKARKTQAISRRDP